MSRFMTSMRHPIFYFRPFLRRLIFFIYDVFKTSFFRFDIYLSTGRVQQNVYFTTIGISFLCWNNLISVNLFQHKINSLLNTAIIIVTMHLESIVPSRTPARRTSCLRDVAARCARHIFCRSEIHRNYECARKITNATDRHLAHRNHVPQYPRHVEKTSNERNREAPENLEHMIFMI